MSTFADTPEAQAADEAAAEKHRAACKEIREHGFADFLDWLRGRFIFAKYNDDEELVAEHVSGQRIFEDYFEIDMNAVERYRRRLIDELHKKASA